MHIYFVLPIRRGNKQYADEHCNLWKCNRNFGSLANNFSLTLTILYFLNIWIMTVTNKFAMQLQLNLTYNIIESHIVQTIRRDIFSQNHRSSRNHCDIDGIPS